MGDTIFYKSGFWVGGPPPYEVVRYPSGPRTSVILVQSPMYRDEDESIIAEGFDSIDDAIAFATLYTLMVGGTLRE